MRKGAIDAIGRAHIKRSHKNMSNVGMIGSNQEKAKWAGGIMKDWKLFVGVVGKN